MFDLGSLSVLLAAFAPALALILALASDRRNRNRTEKPPQAEKLLRPPAQLKIFETAADCLAVIELTVNWEAEKLYSVEGLGPFDEF